MNVLKCNDIFLDQCQCLKPESPSNIMVSTFITTITNKPGQLGKDLRFKNEVYMFNVQYIVSCLSMYD